VRGGTREATSVEDDQAGAVVVAAPATIPPAALDSLLAYAARKGIDAAQLADMAGKPLSTLTEAESQTLTTAVTAYRRPT